MRKILTILLLAVSITAWATKYYVDPTGVNDAGRNGMIGQEWATPSYACTRVSAPDTVFINAGTYNQGSTQIVKPLGVHIMGVGDASHVISTYTSGSAAQAAIQCASTVETTTDDGGSISYIRLTGSNLTSTRAIYVGYRNNVWIHHVAIEDFLNGGIWLHVSNNSLYATGNKITDCIINNSAQARASYQGAIRVSGQSECDVMHNTIDMRERSPGNNGASFEFQRSKKTRIADNTLYRLDSEINSGGTYGWNFFFEGWDYRGDCEYYNNTHYGLAKVSIGGELNGIDAGCTYGFKIHDNVFLNAANGNRNVNGGEEDYYCITMEGDQHQKVEVYNNYIQRYNWGIGLTTPSSGTGYWHHNWTWNDIKIHHNIIENIGYADFASSAIGIWWVNGTNDLEYDGVFDSIVIAHNTITGNNGGTYPGSYGIRMDANEVVTNVTIANNIIYGFAYNAIAIAEHANDSLSITGIDVVHNLMNNNGTNGVSVESAAGRITITDIDVATGNITSDPLFVSSSDFHLQSTSPCRDAGIDVSAITGGKDFHGASLYGAAYDIGAFEYGVGRMINIGTTIPTINYKIVLIDH